MTATMTAMLTAMMALLAATALAPRVAEAQLLTPKEYHAVNPPPSSNGTLNVYTSALLERLLGIDDKKYEFTSIVFLYFSWEDPSAMDKMLTSTDAYRNGSGECESPCVAESKPSREAKGYAPEFSCCDGIWMPQVVAYNLIPPFHTQFNGLIVGKNGTVGWYKSIYAKYFSGMQFSKFPLDSQQLQISLGLNSVAHGPDSQTIQFVPSATSSVFMMRQGIEGQKGKVDSVSGWEIRDVSMEATGVPLIEAVDYFVYDFGTGPVTGEPMPIAGDPDKDSSNPFQDPELRHYGVNIYINVKRLSEYYIINQIIPIYVLVMLSMVTFFHNPSKIDTRVALNLTCFLALTAIKWVVNRELPNSSYPTTVSMIIMTAYAMFGFAVIESIVVFALYKRAEIDEQEEKEKQEAFASAPSSPKAEKAPSLTKSIERASFKLLLQSASSKKWLFSNVSRFSLGIRKLKGDHDHNVTELSIIIDMCSLTLAVITAVVSSAIYFHT